MIWPEVVKGTFAFIYCIQDIISVMTSAQSCRLSSYRPKGSKLTVNPGTAGSSPELLRAAKECSQHSPVCPVHELKGQPRDITAAL